MSQIENNPDQEGAIPSANPAVSRSGQSRPGQRRQVAATVFLLGALGATGVAGYYLFWKRDTAPKATVNEVKNGLASRTFELPPAPPAPPPAQPAPQPAPQPQQAAQPEDKPPAPMVLDKSSSGLMISVPNSQTAAAPAATDAQEGSSQGALGSLLVSTTTAGATAKVLGNRNFILAKGAFINCSLNTAINSSLPGMTSCTVTNDMYSDNGKFVVIERGSTITGEYQSGLHQGDDRLFVLWNRIKTANGVVVSLDSPGTDELGQSGVPGYVDNHYFKRFGSAVLLSVFTTTEDIAKSAVQTVMQNKSGGSNNSYSNTNISTQAPDGIITSALNNSINIAPTLSKNQGDTIGIFVARDLDFTTVYSMTNARWTIPR
jgi:type IV secretion system protein VirB10